jgi:hypothetical protein
MKVEMKNHFVANIAAEYWGDFSSSFGSDAISRGHRA